MTYKSSLTSLLEFDEPIKETRHRFAFYPLIDLTLNLLHIFYLIAALIPHTADIKNVNRRFSPSLFTLGSCHMLYAA